MRAYVENPEIDVAGLMEHVKGPDFPGGGIMSMEGIRDAYASGRGSVRVRGRVHAEPLKGGKDALIVSELPFMVKKGGDDGSDHEDRRSRPREEAGRDLRPARRVRPLRDAHRDRAQARRRPEHRHQQPLQAHPAPAGLRPQHGRAGRRGAAHPLAEGARPPLRRPPARGRHPPDPVRAAPRRGPGPHSRGTARRARQPRRGDRADPRLGRHGRRPRRPDGEVRAHRGAGAGDPRHAPRAPHRARVRQGPRRARGADGSHRRAAGDPRRPRPR